VEAIKANPILLTGEHDRAETMSSPPQA
jgi:hypothetical protein